MAPAPITLQEAELLGNMAVAMVGTGTISRAAANAAKAILRKAADPQTAQATATKAEFGLLKAQQVADRLSCSRRNVFRLADDGTLTKRYLRSGIAKSLRFIEAEVSALCDLPTDGEA